MTIYWTMRENVQANLHRHVKRVLRQHGYPPDKQNAATRTVLEQAEVLSVGWATRFLVSHGLRAGVLRRAGDAKPQASPPNAEWE